MVLPHVEGRAHLNYPKKSSIVAQRGAGKDTKMTDSIAKFFGFGRLEHPNAETPIHISANGTTSVPPDALAEALRAQFAELHEADAETSHKIAVGQE
jgi:hypothetical protein